MLDRIRIREWFDVGTVRYGMISFGFEPRLESIRLFPLISARLAFVKQQHDLSHESPSSLPAFWIRANTVRFYKILN